MAFFGLTYLGEQAYFRDSSEHGLDLALFSEDDLERALDRTVGKNATTVELSKIPDYLVVLYKGPLVPKWDDDLIREQLTALGMEDGAQDVARDVFLEACRKAREATMHPSFHEGRPYKAVEYRSMSEFKDATKRNVRLAHNPRDKFLNPVVSSHSVGWNVGETEFAKLDAKCTKRFPKTASPESLFADAMAAANLQ
ncbi:Hypothetical Protein FCC1311_076382 [Hondaea fermentalgiana]|uniref:Uncharacterized protein n=1 Tax=Hondaea fermentalgiana TaxID=2315210 RepID=A0A2R5GU46_9STRA|nr:Hypothetical Protein FCC1311_076382 [Hondaea fermentalgiana]|eukprot:GBG31414.1 Hypothetical Protein FCC1311_076382 [Hondaea fermentalgiana]